MGTKFEIPFGGRGGGYTQQEIKLISEVASMQGPLTQGPNLKELGEILCRLSKFGRLCIRHF